MQRRIQRPMQTYTEIYIGTYTDTLIHRSILGLTQIPAQRLKQRSMQRRIQRPMQTYTQIYIGTDTDTCRETDIETYTETNAETYKETDTETYSETQ